MAGLLKNRISDLLVTRYLRLGKNAVIRVFDADNSESEVDLNELLNRLDSGNNVRILTAATTLTAADDGKTIILNAATGAAVTLPAPVAGMRMKFYVGATAPSSGAWTVVSNGNATIIYGSVATAADGAATGIGSAEDTITFATTSLPGDMVDVVSDGTNWYVHGQCAVAAAITLTDAA